MPLFAEPRSIFVDVGELRLHLAAWGDTSAPPVILIHGMRDNARSWDWIANALADQYYVIAPDLRGHGDSGWGTPATYSIAAYLLDLSDVVEALALSRFALIGHSLGGAIAVRYAGVFAARVTALCAIEAIELPIIRDQRAAPKTYPTRVGEWIGAERARRGRVHRTYASFDEARERMAEAHTTLDAETIAHITRCSVVRDPQGRLGWKYDVSARLRAPEDANGRDLDETLAAIACPTLLVYGEASWIPLPPPERLEFLRDKTIVTFPDASHWLHHQWRDAFIAALRPFLAASIGKPDRA